MLIALRAIHNPRPKGPSNLRTLRPIGPVKPKNLPLRPFISIICMRSYIEKLLFLVYNTDKIQ